jgi:hypothetical protein
MGLAAARTVIVLPGRALAVFLAALRAGTPTGRFSAAHLFGQLRIVGAVRGGPAGRTILRAFGTGGTFPARTVFKVTAGTILEIPARAALVITTRAIFVVAPGALIRIPTGTILSVAARRTVAVLRARTPALIAGAILAAFPERALARALGRGVGALGGLGGHAQIPFLVVGQVTAPHRRAGPLLRLGGGFGFDAQLRALGFIGC